MWPNFIRPRSNNSTLISASIIDSLSINKISRVRCRHSFRALSLLINSHVNTKPFKSLYIQFLHFSHVITFKVNKKNIEKNLNDLDVPHVYFLLGYSYHTHTHQVAVSLLWQWQTISRSLWNWKMKRQTLFEYRVQ